ncbi:MAG: hypothetical protein JWP91_464 [Fibrobacteres bacterium]|nr:hypothetical protein [Fibrobacterota bacterium]
MLRAGTLASMAAALFMGCGGSAPDPRDRGSDPAPAAQSQEGENGEGTISFHYSNKSTDANLAIDLGNTDLYMEMTGLPKAPAEEARPPERKPDEARPAPRPQPQAQAEKEPDPGEEEPAPSKAAKRKPAPKKDKEEEKDAGSKLELPKDEEQPDYEDVTAKVLTGIRKAQELFYQKRYPEAMLAVKSSLDARPTAEGYALAGSIHYMMGQNGMARRQWSEALRLNPDMPSVVNMLEKTRTPGGRGSPSPRPIQSRPAAVRQVPSLPEADNPPFPEEYSGPSVGVPMAAPAAPQAPASGPGTRPSPVPEPEPASEEAVTAPAAAPAGEAAATPAPEAAPAEPAVRPSAKHAAAKPPAPVPAKPQAPAPSKAADSVKTKEKKAK